jgi:hypothetical protein
VRDRITYVGLDVHKDAVVVAMAEGGIRGEVANTAAALDWLMRKLGDGGVRLRFCYEAGPCGYGIQRHVSTHGHECVVVARTGIGRGRGTLQDSWEENSDFEIGTLCLRLSHPVGVSARPPNRFLTLAQPMPDDRREPARSAGGPPPPMPTPAVGFLYTPMMFEKPPEFFNPTRSVYSETGA